MSNKKAVVVNACTLAGKDYKPGELVELDASVIEEAEAAGSVDSSDAAVAAASGESKAAKQVKARVLVACTIDGEDYRPNDKVIASAAAIKRATKDGFVDASTDAVAFIEASAQKS